MDNKLLGADAKKKARDTLEYCPRCVAQISSVPGCWKQFMLMRDTRDQAAGKGGDAHHGKQKKDGGSTRSIRGGSGRGGSSRRPTLDASAKQTGAGLLAAGFG